jgi:hypothetical protein
MNCSSSLSYDDGWPMNRSFSASHRGGSATDCSGWAMKRRGRPMKPRSP